MAETPSKKTAVHTLVDVPSQGLAHALRQALSHHRSSSYARLLPLLYQDPQGDMFISDIPVYTEGEDKLLGYKIFPNEPDIKIAIPPSTSSDVGMVKQFIKQLRSDLPGIEISSQHSNPLLKVITFSRLTGDIDQWPDETKIPSKLTLTINRKSLIDALEKTESPTYRKPYEALKSLTDRYNKAASKSADNTNGIKKEAYFLADLVNTGDKSGPFFETSKLAELISKGKDTPALSDCKVVRSNFNKHNIEASIDYLLKNGITRLSYVGKGARTLAFRSIPDEQGRQQLVLFSPIDDKQPDTPFHLPAHATQNCGEVLVRIMPMLTQLPKAPAQAAKEMHRMLGSKGLSQNDIREANVFYYEYEDKSGAHRVPMIIDWDAGPTYLTRTQADALKTDRSIEPWRAAQEHLKGHGIQNTITQEGLENYTSSRRRAYDAASDNTQPSAVPPSYVEQLAKDGFSPFEISAILETASHEDGRSFAERINDARKNIDLTQQPKHQH